MFIPGNSLRLVGAIVAIVVAGALVVLYAGCNPPAEVVRPQDLRLTRPGADTLVVVYSRSGHTARVAETLAEALGADYQRLQGRGDEGDSFFKTPSWKTRVAIAPASMDLGAYRRIVIATPIWYWRPSALAMSFIAANDLRGKDVVLLYTNQGGIWQRGIDGWRGAVTERGGRVVRVVGVDRKKLAPGETLEARARSIARELGAR